VSESGAILGYFVPASDQKRSALQMVQESVTDEESIKLLKNQANIHLKKSWPALKTNEVLGCLEVGGKRQIAEIWMQAPNRKEVAIGSQYNRCRLAASAI